jgi:two-component system, OmpR family, sensor kinase
MRAGKSAGGRERRRLLHPGSWPVRWRLALASAGLTLLILLVFGGVIGHFAGERIHDDFNRELKGAVRTLAGDIRISEQPTGSYMTQGPHLEDYVRSNDATVWIFDSQRQVVDASPKAVYIGPPKVGIEGYGSMRVATAAVVGPSGRLAGYVQYARSSEDVESTIARLWLFIAAGVLGGTLLASLAGLTIADRAMRPVASLTATAREIADTRDPSRKMPEPKAEDEVGELTRTLGQMLHALDSAREEREQAMQKQREFVADASHELRTPLTSVLANLELLQASLEQPDHPEDREIVDSALRSSRRMSRLVADLLLLARADAGRRSERRSCDLAEIAGHAAAEVAPVSGERQLSVENGTPIVVEGNPDELHRLVLNLLDNAVRHTPEGSRIELRLGVDRASQMAWLEVSDDGPGIPEELSDQVFDRFVRGSGPADTAAGNGTGLGLAIVRAVTTSHGGEVGLAESPQGGALFRVRLPLTKSSESVSPSLGAL